MFTRSLFALSLAFALFACGGDNAATDAPDTPVAAPAVVETGTPDAFITAQTALADGKSAAEVSQLLLDKFDAVSNPNTGMLDMVASKDYVKIAQQLSDKYPNDTLAALPYYKSAEVVRAMNNPTRAAEIYKTVTERYPSFSKAGEALFMLGFTYDEDLGDMDAAKATYERFLKEYPNHGFADDTEMLLQNLGKSDEEILRELEKQGE